MKLEDPGVFRTFYDDVFPQVNGYFQRRCGDLQQANDLTQETFLAAVRRIRAGEDVRDPRAWIFGIARHKLVDHYRHQSSGRRALQRLRGESPSPPGQWDGPDNPLGEVSRALARLPAEHRAVLVLHHVDDLPVDEVAAILGRSPSAVESLLVRARAALRTQYEGVRDVA